MISSHDTKSSAFSVGSATSASGMDIYINIYIWIYLNIFDILGILTLLLTPLLQLGTWTQRLETNSQPILASKTPQHQCLSTAGAIPVPLFPRRIDKISKAWLEKMPTEWTILEKLLQNDIPEFLEQLLVQLNNIIKFLYFQNKVSPQKNLRQKERIQQSALQTNLQAPTSTYIYHCNQHTAAALFISGTAFGPSKGPPCSAMAVSSDFSWVRCHYASIDWKWCCLQNGPSRKTATQWGSWGEENASLTFLEHVLQQVTQYTSNLCA